MNRCMLMAFMLAAFCAILFLFGCSYVSVQSHQYLGMPEFPATDPSSIEILHAPPARPHDRIGEITLFPEGNPSKKEIENKLRTTAAQMGANAVVIVSDSTKEVGEYMSGPWWDRQINTEWGRVIVAVPIRYRQDEQKSPTPDKRESQEKNIRMSHNNSSQYPL
jgi:hypothetical protein